MSMFYYFYEIHIHMIFLTGFQLIRLLLRLGFEIFESRLDWARVNRQRSRHRQLCSGIAV